MMEPYYTPPPFEIMSPNFLCWIVWYFLRFALAFFPILRGEKAVKL